MTRRNFLTKLGIGLVATAALAHVPASLVKRSEWLAASGQKWATQQLHNAWHKHYASMKRGPDFIRVSQNLYDLYESELIAVQRFVDKAEDNPIPWLAFKGSRVTVSKSLTGYGLYTEQHL